MLDLWNLRLRPGTPSGDSVEARMDFYSVPEPMSGCVLWWGALDKYGYGYLRIGKKNLKAHRIAWEKKNKRRVPKGRLACHKCDLPCCVNEDHVWLGTQKANTADKMAKGRANFAVGEAFPHTKLKESDIAVIRSDRRSNAQTAAAYGVSASLISNIRTRKIWKHVP